MAVEDNEDYFNQQITKLIPKDWIKWIKAIIVLVANWHNL